MQQTKKEGQVMKLLTQEDLAERWQVKKRTIEKWRYEGLLQPVKGIPSIRFHPKHIAELEGVRMEPFSPLERRRLERELKQLEKENEELKGILSKVLAETSKVINL